MIGAWTTKTSEQYPTRADMVKAIQAGMDCSFQVSCQADFEDLGAATLVFGVGSPPVVRLLRDNRRLTLFELSAKNAALVIAKVLRLAGMSSFATNHAARPRREVPKQVGPKAQPADRGLPSPEMVATAAAVAGTVAGTAKAKVLKSDTQEHYTRASVFAEREMPKLRMRDRRAVEMKGLVPLGG